MAQANTNQSPRNAFDVCFRVGDGLYYGHKARLIKASLYFKTMFACNFKEAHQDTNLEPIEVPNVEPKYFEIMLKYNECNRLLGLSSIEEAEALYSMAEYFIYDNFASALSTYIGTRLNRDNVCMIWNQAHASAREELCGFCLKFFTANFQDVALTPEFLVLHRELLLEALNSGEIDCSEDFILASVRSWVKYQVWKQHQENNQNNNNNNGAHPPNFNFHILEADLKKMLLDFLPPKTVFSYRNKRMLMRSF